MTLQRPERLNMDDDRTVCVVGRCARADFDDASALLAAVMLEAGEGYEASYFNWAHLGDDEWSFSFVLARDGWDRRVREFLETGRLREFVQPYSHGLFPSWWAMPQPAYAVDGTDGR